MIQISLIKQNPLQLTYSSNVTGKIEMQVQHFRPLGDQADGSLLKELQVRGEPGANEPRLRASSRGRKGDANLPALKLNRERNRDIRSKVKQDCGSKGTCCPPDPRRLLHTRPRSQQSLHDQCHSLRGVCRFHAKGRLGQAGHLSVPAAYVLSSAPCGLKHMGKACGKQNRSALDTGVTCWGFMMDVQG